jgi:hypothetical protein
MRNYGQERDKRLNPAGQAQYVRVAGEYDDVYATDPHQPVVPREPVCEEIDTSQLQRECTPSYSTNEGQVKDPWALLRSYGPGWPASMNSSV